MVRFQAFLLGAETGQQGGVGYLYFWGGNWECFGSDREIAEARRPTLVHA